MSYICWAMRISSLELTQQISIGVLSAVFTFYGGLRLELDSRPREGNPLSAGGTYLFSQRLGQGGRAALGPWSSDVDGDASVSGARVPDSTPSNPFVRPTSLCFVLLVQAPL